MKKLSLVILLMFVSVFYLIGCGGGGGGGSTTPNATPTPASGTTATPTLVPGITATPTSPPSASPTPTATSVSDIYLINALLDSFQTAMTNKDVNAIVSFCTFPYTDGRTDGTADIYYNAAAYKEDLTELFSDIKSYNIFTMTNRVINISGTSASVVFTRHYKYTYLDNSVEEDISSWRLTGQKINGTWKASGVTYVGVSSNAVSKTKTKHSFLGDK